MDEFTFLRNKKIMEQRQAEAEAQLQARKEAQQRMFEDFRAEKFGGLSDIEKARILKDPMARAQFDHNSKVEMFANAINGKTPGQLNEIETYANKSYVNPYGKLAEALSQPPETQMREVRAPTIDQVKGGLGDALMVIGLQKALDIPEAGAGSDIVPRPKDSGLHPIPLPQVPHLTDEEVKNLSGAFARPVLTQKKEVLKMDPIGI